MTDDLKALIGQIEQQRKRKDVYRFMGASAAGIGALVLLFVFIPKPAPAPVAEAPGKEVPSPFANIVLQGKAAIVYDLTTGEIIYEKNAKAQLPLASLTKLLTVYAGATSLGTGSIVTITDSSLVPEGDSGFFSGESFAFSELAKAALVASSNDAAQAISESAEGKRALSASALLGNAAASAGLAATYALNGTGLDENGEISGGYGSAEDVAILAGALLKRASDIAKATAQPSITISSLSGNTYEFKNTNPDVETIPGLALSKTGFTDLAGGNLAVIFDASVNHPIAVVVLGSTIDGRFSDVEALVRATLTSFVTLPSL